MPPEEALAYVVEEVDIPSAGQRGARLPIGRFVATSRTAKVVLRGHTLASIDEREDLGEKGQ